MTHGCKNRIDIFCMVQFEAFKARKHSLELSSLQYILNTDTRQKTAFIATLNRVDSAFVESPISSCKYFFNMTHVHKRVTKYFAGKYAEISGLFVFCSCQFFVLGLAALVLSLE